MSRPKVIVYGDASVDGRLAVSPDRPLLWGDERWTAVSPPSTALDFLRCTHRYTATLEGSGSFMPEGMQPEPLPAYEGDPSGLYDDYLPEAVLEDPGRVGWFCAVDGRGRVRWMYKSGDAFPGYEGWYALVFVSRATPPEYLAYLRREEIPYLVAGEGPVDLGAALDKLGERLGVTCLLSTAGGRLNGALLRAGLVDEINVDFFPAVIGGTHTPALFTAPDLEPHETPTRLRLVSALVHGEGRVLLRYEVLK